MGFFRFESLCRQCDCVNVVISSLYETVPLQPHHIIQLPEAFCPRCICRSSILKIIEYRNWFVVKSTSLQQSCGSVESGYGSRSSISSEPGSGSNPDAGFWWLKTKEKKYSWKFFYIFFWSKIAIYLSLGVHNGLPSYRRSLSPPKRTSSTSKNEIYKPFFFVCGSFLPSWIRIQIQGLIDF